jgi:hypothetical protein
MCHGFLFRIHNVIKLRKCLDCGIVINRLESKESELCDLCGGIRKRAFWGSFIMFMKDKN